MNTHALSNYYIKLFNTSFPHSLKFCQIKDVLIYAVKLVQHGAYTFFSHS